MNEITENTKGKMKGVIKWFSNKLGYGFIIPVIESSGTGELDMDKEVFVHFSSIETPEENGFKTLYRGDKVLFELVENDRGLEARAVEIVEKSPRRAKYQKRFSNNNNSEPIME